MRKTICVLLCIGIVLPLVLLFWLFAVWGDGMQLLLRVLPALCTEVLLRWMTKRIWLRLLPVFLTALLALWGVWLFCTSPHWVNATFWDC